MSVAMTMLKSTRVFLAAATVAAMLVPALAHAQDQRLRVSFGGAATAGALDGQPAIVGSVGYRFAERLSFDGEFTFADGTADRFPDLQFFDQRVVQTGITRFGSMLGGGRNGLGGLLPPGGGFTGGQSSGALFLPGGTRLEREGNTSLATVGLRYEFPSQVGRFVPYVTGGLGISRTESSLRLSSGTVTGTRPGIIAPAIPMIDFDEGLSHTGLAARAGVGASVRIYKQLSADVDARYFRLDRGRNLGQFGGGVSYRF
jgi:opacity protein-like surface antigen